MSEHDSGSSGRSASDTSLARPVEASTNGALDFKALWRIAGMKDCIRRIVDSGEATTDEVQQALHWLMRERAERRAHEYVRRKAEVMDDRAAPSGPSTDAAESSEQRPKDASEAKGTE